MKKKETSVVNKIFVISLCVLLSLYALSMIMTLVWGFMTSLKNPMELEGKNPNWLGFPILDESKTTNSIKHFFEFENYATIFKNYDRYKSRVYTKRSAYYAFGGTQLIPAPPSNYAPTLLDVAMNTIVYTAIGSILHTVIPAIVAYACVKYDNPVAKIITGAALFALTTPIIGAQASMLTMLRNLALYDTIWGYLLQKAGFGGTYFFVFLAFYQSVPDSFSEAAEIDGASQFHILVKIIIPLSIKTLSTVFLIQFIHFWNDYQTANLYMPSHPTIAFFVWKMTQLSDLAEPTLQIATTMMLALPILIAFIFLKDKLMGNVSMGGLKQ